MTIYQMCFTIASILWAIQFLPQIIKTLKTKKVDDISIYCLLLSFTGHATILIGFALSKQWWPFITISIPTLMVAFQLELVSRFKKWG